MISAESRFKKYLQSRKKLIAGIGVVLGCLFGPAVYGENFSEEIKNSSDLIRIVKEEEPRARKNSASRHIYWRYGKTPWGTAASAKISEEDYMIILDGRRNRTTICHELYHIYGGHCDKAFEKGDWTTADKIKNEITANLYAWYGLRL